jgi:hypothetical protein
MPRLNFFACIALVAALPLAMIGCNRTAEDANRPPVSIDELESDHAGHAHAETYAEAVAELDTMRSQISAAFAASDMEAADGPIHEVGHVLEEVVELAQKQGLDADAVAEINAAVEKLFDAFGRVDDKIHGGEGAEYSEVEADVDAAFATLRKHVPATE